MTVKLPFCVCQKFDSLTHTHTHTHLILSNVVDSLAWEWTKTKIHWIFAVTFERLHFDFPGLFFFYRMVICLGVLVFFVLCGFNGLSGWKQNNMSKFTRWNRAFFKWLKKNIRFKGIKKPLEYPLLLQTLTNQCEIWWHRQCLNRFAFASKHEHIVICMFISLANASINHIRPIDQKFCDVRRTKKWTNRRPNAFSPFELIRIHVNQQFTVMQIEQNKTFRQFKMVYQFLVRGGGPLDSENTNLNTQWIVI